MQWLTSFVHFSTKADRFTEKCQFSLIHTKRRRRRCVVLSKKAQTKMANNSSRKSILLALLTLIWYLLLRRKITRLLLRCTLRQNFIFCSSKYAMETSKSILYFGHQNSKCNEKKIFSELNFWTFNWGLPHCVLTPIFWKSFSSNASSQASRQQRLFGPK